MQIGKKVKTVTSPKREIRRIQPKKVPERVPVPNWPMPVREPARPIITTGV